MRKNLLLCLIRCGILPFDDGRAARIRASRANQPKIRRGNLDEVRGSRAHRRFAGWRDRHRTDFLVAAVFDDRDLLWRLRWLLSHQVGASDLGQHAGGPFSATLSMAAADHAESAKLR